MPSSSTSFSRRTCAGLALAVAGLVLVLSSGCSVDDAEGPVADSTMVPLLIDLHLFRARSTFRNRPELSDSIFAARDSIFARRGVSRTQMEEMMNVYARNPERYTDLYTTVIDSLNALRVTLSRASRDSSLLDSLIRNPPPDARRSP
ncbi:DUF4296 domain-containing protein [Longibacter sp.]|jgi:hypothetical protein|uniref:DUF4296 domain-containing protein n=1 Tax=Longibacter sp. TaxID=2045415 RepID=UPI003EB9ED40